MKIGRAMKRLIAGALLLALIAVSVFLTRRGGGGSEEETDAFGRPVHTVEPVPTGPAVQASQSGKPEGTDGDQKNRETDPLFFGLSEEEKEQMETRMREAAEEEELIVWGPLPETVLAAVCGGFTERFGIPVRYRFIGGNDLYSGMKKGEFRGKADVWFGSRLDPVSEGIGDGILSPYEALRRGCLLSDKYADPEGYWYAAGEDPLGMLCIPGRETVSWEELSAGGPGIAAALPDPNYTQDGQFLVTALVQILGHDTAVRRFAGIRENGKLFTSGSRAAAEAAGQEGITEAACFLSDAAAVLSETGQDGTFRIPAEGTAGELHVTAVFAGAPHRKAAELWQEYALSPLCAGLLRQASVTWLPTAAEPEGTEKGNDPVPEEDRARIIRYDFEEGKERRLRYLNDYYAAQ